MKLQIEGLTRRFGSFVANDRIDLVVEPGEVHCILGENGAGKSTLMNMLYGLLEPSEGRIVIDGTHVRFRSPADAIAAGIGMVHQHFMLIPVFTVAENIMLGRELTSLPGVLSRRQAADKVRELSQRYGLRVDPASRVEDLPVGVQQRVEILKALAHDAKVLILDEPTAVLTPQETDDLMAIMRALTEQGASIIFITHKLREVREVGDTITVIRRGRVVGRVEPTTSEAELAALMVGRDVQLTVAKDEAVPGPEMLEVDGCTLVDPRGREVVKNVSFSVRAGEVLGIAGVQGNGQTELVKALLGLVRPDTGTIRLDGSDITTLGTKARLEAGIGFVPEDRSHDGYVAKLSVRENLILDLYRHDEFSRGPVLRRRAIAANANKRIDEFDIRTSSPDAAISSLSGGNQQKVVIAREFSRPLKLLVVSQPTRGVDVGSIEFIHRRIVAERDQGTAVVIVSTELEEVCGLADRVAVMHDGEIVDIVDPEVPREELGLLMAGAGRHEVSAVPQTQEASA